MAADVEGKEYLQEMFREVPSGYLVDVGAEDGTDSGSMSRDLLVAGWRGILVEPLPRSFNKLQRTYANRHDVFCFRLACSDRAGQAPLIPYRSVSTLEPDWARACAEYWKHVKYQDPILVQTIPLSVLLEDAGAPRHIHFLKVDTEGHDLRVLQGMDWSREVDVICVETLDMVHRERKQRGVWLPDPELDEYLVSKGFRCSLLTKGGNAFYVKGGAQ